MKRFFKWYIVSHLLISQVVMASHVSVLELSSHADALNIEGGIIPSQELKKDQIWSNLAVVLDRPIVTKETLKEITAKNPFSLKEASILSFDEHKVNIAYAAILNYYLLQGRSILNKLSTDEVNIVFQIHRNSSAKKHLDLLLKILEPWLSSNQLVKQEADNQLPNHLATYYFKPTNSTIEFRKGFSRKDLSSYENVDIVVSFSMVAGLQTSQDSGTLLIPQHFIPYEVDSSELHFSEKFSARNHLKEVLNEVLSVQSDVLLEHVHTIDSENPLKTKSGSLRLTENDFYEATILQADGYFYPSFN